MLPEIVLFDAGGIFYIPDHTIALNTAAKLGFSLDPSRIDAAHYKAAATFIDRPIDDDPHDRYWNDYLAAYALAIGARVAQHGDAVRELASQFRAVPIWQRVIPGAVDGLWALHRAGVRLGIVSNHDGTIEAMLRRDHIAQVGAGDGVPVEVIVDSAVIGYRKPDPRIFNLACRVLDIEPSNALYVGDMPAIDAVGARAAGMECVIMDPWGAHRANERYATVRSIQALLER